MKIPTYDILSNPSFPCLLTLSIYMLLIFLSQYDINMSTSVLILHDKVERRSIKELGSKTWVQILALYKVT